MAGLEAQFKELDAGYRRLEESLGRLSAKFPQVTIEHVHIHQPVLEKLEFRMDGLDIENLSGSLNLGNNFGAKFNPAPASGTAGKQRTDDSKPNSEGLHRTPKGYRFQAGR